MAAVLKPTDFATDSNSVEPRYNIYTIIHKALRGFMTDTLLRWGKADTTDAQELAEVITHTRDLLEMCAGHIQHENTFLHPALEAARHGAAGQTAGDHIEHEAAIAGLRTQVAAVERSNHFQREVLAQQFYLRLSAFIAENFEHMLVEETSNQTVFSEAYSDAEILTIEQQIIASLTPDELFKDLRWMIGHINAAERAFMLGGMKQGAPPPVFAAVMGLAREVLSERDFNKLATALA